MAAAEQESRAEQSSGVTVGPRREPGQGAKGQMGGEQLGIVGRILSLSLFDFGQ